MGIVLSWGFHDTTSYGMSLIQDIWKDGGGGGKREKIEAGERKLSIISSLGIGHRIRIGIIKWESTHRK